MTDLQNISVERLKNGLTVIVEEIPDLESVAYELLIPGGIVLDRPGLEGSCLMLSELTSRGAGPFDSRALSNEFDGHGIRHSEGAGQDRFNYHGTMLPEELGHAVMLLGLMLREPHLPAADVEGIRNVLLQDLASLPDNPGRHVMHELHRQYFPAPFNRSALGTEAGLLECGSAQQRNEWSCRYGAERSIFSVAGKCRREDVLDIAGRHLGAWRGGAEPIPEFAELPGPTRYHMAVESAQLQIAIGFPSVKFGDELYYAAKIGMGVLSGGMFGRLFTEVREKRGLVYSVYARHGATCDYGWVNAYAGTTPERAQETLDVMLRELRHIRGTVSQEELARAKSNLKSSIVIGEESAGSRASSNAQDYWLSKRVRPLDEIIAKLDAVGTAEVDAFFDAYPFDKYTLVTLGAKELA